MADERTKAVIYECHRRAIDIVLAYAEREVFHSRSGTNGIVQEDIVGVVAASFTHWDSRAGDPQLHDHVVVLNRAQSVSDGKWRTLDSRGLFKATVALSELHQGVLSDLLTQELGWGWDGRARRHSDRLRFEVTGVSEALMAEFSQRAEGDRRPQGRPHRRVRQRPGAPSDLDRDARPAPAGDTRDPTRQDLPQPGGDDRRLAPTGQAAMSAISRSRGWRPWPDATTCRSCARAIWPTTSWPTSPGSPPSKVADTRATFSRANVAAEVHRQLHGVRFATPAERIAVAERTVEIALGQSLLADAAGPAPHPGAVPPPRRHLEAASQGPRGLHQPRDPRRRGPAPRRRPKNRRTSGQPGDRRRQ